MRKAASPVKEAAAAPKKKPIAAKPRPKNETVDLDKLAKAVAVHETGDCTAKVGSALYNNCHGFRRSGRFLRFKNKQESYEYFEDLWTRNYGGGMPTAALATAYVCGWEHLKKAGTGTPCEGGVPMAWLSSVLRKYDTL